MGVGSLLVREQEQETVDARNKVRIENGRRAMSAFYWDWFECD